MYAVDNLGDAIDVTREFLTPIRKWMWLKLALVVFFVSSFSSAPTPTTDVSWMGEPQTEEVPAEELPTLEPELIPVLVGLAIVLAAIGLFFAAIAAIMEFVLVGSLRAGEVHVRRYGKRHLGRALRLFGFRIGLGLLVLALIGGPLALVEFAGPGLTALGLAPIALLGVYAVVVGLVYLVVDKFTTEFVVPVMLLEERGVLSAWRRFWPALATNKLEYLVYAIVSVVVAIVLGIAITIVWGLAILVLLIPAVIVGVGLFFLGPIGLVIGIPLAIAFVIVVFLLYFLLEVPVISYLRYYALLVLGDTDPELDLIPEQRGAVRDGDDWDDEPGAGARDDGDGGDGGWGGDWDDEPASESREDEREADDRDDGWGGGWDDDPDDENDRSDEGSTDGWDVVDEDEDDDRW